MGCAAGITKILLFIVNLVFALAGLALLIVGILFKLNVNEVTNVVPDALEVAPTLLIIVGSIVFAISFFGCCGAVRESTCMLTTYAVILLVIFLLQVAVGVFAFLQIRDSTDLKQQFRTALEHPFSTFATNQVSYETVNIIQTQYQCCGLDSPSDIRFLNGSYPASCCKEVPVDEYCSTPSFTQGCFQIFFDAIVEIIKIIGIVAISIAAIEILGAIAALCLSSSIKNQYRRGAYA